MAYPSTIDSPTTNVDNVDVIYAADVNNLQTAVVALETKVGVDSSAVTSSHDYKLSEVTDKAVGKTATQTLTNKTLTSPVVNVGSDATGDMYYRNAGVLTRIPVGTDNQIMKLNGATPNWEAETVVVAATESVEGISRLATAAQITAGTASESGYPLVVTPDQLASSTPVFNGSGLTNIHKASNGTLTISATGTTTITTNFRPKEISVYAVIANGASATVAAHSQGGYGVTSNTNACVYTQVELSGTSLGDQTTGIDSSNCLHIYSASSGTVTTAVINNLTATTFDIVATKGTTDAQVFWQAIGY